MARSRRPAGLDQWFWIYSSYILYGGFLKLWYPQNIPKSSCLVGKPMVVGYHHFRKQPYILYTMIFMILIPWKNEVALFFPKNCSWPLFVMLPLKKKGICSKTTQNTFDSAVFFFRCLKTENVDWHFFNNKASKLQLLTWVHKHPIRQKT